MQNAGVQESSDPRLEPRRLVAGQDYPRTYREFVVMFPDAEECARYLERLRWPEGFVCPACGVKGEPWRASRGRRLCRGCREHVRVGAGTIFDKTRTPLTTWFEAAWHLTTAKNGLSAKTLVGGVEHGGKRGRGTTKSIVVVAVEIIEPKGFGRLRMRHVPDASGDSLLPFVCDVVAHGSTVHTDGWGGYNELSKHGYSHHKTVQSSSGDPAHVSMPGVHRVASLLKRWILGTHQGSVTQDHLHSYLEEFTFRFNRRTSRSRGLVFRRLLEQAVVTRPITEADVTHGYQWKQHNT